MGRDVVREALNTIAVGLRRSCGVEGRGCGFVDVDLCGDRRRMFPVQFCRTADLINEQYGLLAGCLQEVKEAGLGVMMHIAEVCTDCLDTLFDCSHHVHVDCCGSTCCQDPASAIPQHRCINTLLIFLQFEALVAPLVQRTVEPHHKALINAGTKFSLELNCSSLDVPYVNFNSSVLIDCLKLRSYDSVQYFRVACLYNLDETICCYCFKLLATSVGKTSATPPAVCTTLML